MTKEEMMEKLKTAQDLMADVYGEVCYMDKQYYEGIEQWLSCADSCVIDSIETLRDYIEEGV
jgi:hypothetical protein